MPPFTDQVRAEVSLLHRLRHSYVIDFIGVVLQPLCFILEWAPGGSFHSLLQKYKKMDARISPRALQTTAYQVWGVYYVMHMCMYVCTYVCMYSRLNPSNAKIIFEVRAPLDSIIKLSHTCLIRPDQNLIDLLRPCRVKFDMNITNSSPHEPFLVRK